MIFFSLMVNAWSLAWEALNGTMDEEYPIIDTSVGAGNTAHKDMVQIMKLITTKTLLTTIQIQMINTLIILPLKKFMMRYGVTVLKKQENQWHTILNIMKKKF